MSPKLNENLPPASYITMKAYIITILNQEGNGEVAFFKFSTTKQAGPRPCTKHTTTVDYKVTMRTLAYDYFLILDQKARNLCSSGENIILLIIRYFLCYISVKICILYFHIMPI